MKLSNIPVATGVYGEVKGCAFVCLPLVILVSSEPDRAYFNLAHTSQILRNQPMARLSKAPHPLYTIPLSSRTTKPVAGDQRSMPSSPPLRPLALEASLQSYGNDNLSASPPRQDSSHSSLSPADCRTLEKILRDVSSPPATPSTLEQGDPLFPDDGRINTTDTVEEEDGYHFIGGEATDTSCEGKDDSMELSEGEETVTDQVATSLGEPVSPSVSKIERRLQGGVSARDEKEKLGYSSSRRSSASRRSKTKRSQQDHTVSQDATGADTTEDLMNIPGKCTPPARPLDPARNNSDRQTTEDDITHLTRMRSSTEKVLEQERLKQEHIESDKEPQVFISTVARLQGQAQDDGESEPDGFAVDDEQIRPHFSLGISGAPRRKVCKAAFNLTFSGGV